MICENLNAIWGAMVIVLAILTFLLWRRGLNSTTPWLPLGLAIVACAIYAARVFVVAEYQQGPVVLLWGALSIACVLAAPFFLGIAFGLAKGKRLFVLAAGLTMFVALPDFRLLLRLFLHCDLSVD